LDARVTANSARPRRGCRLDGVSTAEREQKVKLDLDRHDQDKIHAFALLLRELIQNHFGDDLEVPTLFQIRHIMSQDDIGMAVIDQWIEVSEGMEKSTFNR